MLKISPFVARVSPDDLSSHSPDIKTVSYTSLLNPLSVPQNTTVDEFKRARAVASFVIRPRFMPSDDARARADSSYARAVASKLHSHSQDVRVRAVRRLALALACGTRDAFALASPDVFHGLARVFTDLSDDESALERAFDAFVALCELAPARARFASEGVRERLDALARGSSSAARRARDVLRHVDAIARDDRDKGEDEESIRAIDDANATTFGTQEWTTGESEDASRASSRRVTFERASARVGANDDDGYVLPFCTTSQSDVEYLYALSAKLETSENRGGALVSLRELRRAVVDLPIECVCERGSRALARACELLAAYDPEQSSVLTRKEALGVIAQCAIALQRELIDMDRACLLARAPERQSLGANGTVVQENFPPDSRGHGYGAAKGEPTRVLPIAHTFMTHVIPAMREPLLRADAIRAARLLLPLVQISPADDAAPPHHGALTRLGQYLDLFEATLEGLEFESGAASEYLTCVQVSAEFASFAGGASARGTGAANARLVKRWYSVCVDEVFAAANPLARQYCAGALINVCPTLARELAIVHDADQCLHAVTTAVSGAETATPMTFAKLVLKATPALSLMNVESNAGQMSANMIATLLALTSEDDAADVRDNVVIAVLALLTHAVTEVRTSAYATLAAASAIDSAACSVLEHPAIIGEVIVGGLNHSSTMMDAATCLESACAVTHNHHHVAGQITCYSAWFDALDGDDAVGVAVSEARRLIERVRRETAGGKWERLIPAVRGLFHESEQVRTTSAVDVARNISHGHSASAQVLISSSSDPLDEVLLTEDEYVRDEHTKASSAPNESSKLKTFTDVRDLLQAFLSSDPRSREAIAIELENLARDPRLAQVLADAASLDSLLQAALETSAPVNVVTGTLRVLAAAAGASLPVREMLILEDARGCRMMRTLRLVFHPQSRVREAMALLLMQMLFVPVMEAVAAREGSQKPTILSLPKLFLETYRFPVFVPELAISASLGDSNPFQDDFVNVERVAFMFKQRRVLKKAYGGASAVDALSLFAMNEDLENDDADTRVMRDAARISCPPFVIGGLISELGMARSHEAAARVVAALKTLAQTSRPHAMSLLASLGRWPEASARFVRRTPRTTPDAWLWVDLAETLSMCLESMLRVKDGTLPYAAVRALVDISREVIQPLTSAGARLNDDANDDPSRDPPALRHPLAAAKALGAEGGEQCSARASAVRAGMELFTSTCEALRRFSLRASPEDAVTELMSSFLAVDGVGTITDALLSIKNCDYTARVASIDAATTTLRLVGSPPSVVADFVSALLTNVCPTFSRDDHRGSTLVNKATAGLLQVMECGPREGWTNAWYAQEGLQWLGDMLVDSSSRTRARAYELLAAAVGPGSPIVDVIASAFPNIFELATECALNRYEAAIVRASACRCIAALIAGSAAAELAVDVPDDGYYSGAKSQVPFPSIPMLAASDVWRGLARVINDDIEGDDERVVVLHRGASAALLAAARVDAQGVAEAFEFDPNHDKDGNMWYGAFAALKRAHNAFAGRAFVDAAHAASNIASLLGVILVAGVRSFDAKLAAAALRESLIAAAHVMRSANANEAVARLASRCSESLATVLQVTSRGDADVISTSGLATHCSEILSTVVGEGSRAEYAHAATGVCLLVTTLFRSRASASRARDGAFENVGASLLESLVSLWELRSRGNIEQITRAPTMAIVIAAMRNVLAYDMSAKAAACEWGLVEGLIATANAAVRRAWNANRGIKPPPTAADAYAATSATKARKDALAAALEFGTTADGDELPSSIVLSSLTCLRHLMYTPIDDAEYVMQFDEIVNDIRESAMDADISSLFAVAWPYAKADQAVMYELLSLVTNFVAEHVNAKRVLTVTAPSTADGDKPTSFALQMMDYAFDVKRVPGSASLELCLKALSSLASVEGPARYWLIRSVFVEETAMTLSHALMKFRALGEDAVESKDVVKARWMKTIAASARALGHVASFPEGQRVVLRTNSTGTHILELCLEIVAAATNVDLDARREAFLLMHNLAFHADAKTHFAANARVLDTLTHTVGDADVQSAAIACATLFALVHHGQRIVAALRENGRDRALRAASKSKIAPSSDGAYFTQWSRSLRGLLAVLATSENAERWDGVSA